MRAERFRRFSEMVEDRPAPVRILDLGGTNAFWKANGYAGSTQVEVTTVNPTAEKRVHANVTPTVGSATALPHFADGAFDLVFSNSTIEHLFTAQAQAQMASEIRRLAPGHFIQTPNFWFPMEPHYLTPGWQWLPVRLRIEILRRRRVGHRGPRRDPAAARLLVEEIRLLTRRQMRVLFPDSEIVQERIGPLTKSLMAIRDVR